MKKRNVMLVAGDRPAMLDCKSTKPFYRITKSIQEYGDTVESVSIKVSDFDTIESKLNEFTTFIVHGTWADNGNGKKEKQVQKFIVDYATKNNAELLVLESALLSRIVPDKKGKHLEKYHRIGLNHWLYNRGIFIDNKSKERYKNFLNHYKISPTEWKRDGDYALVILGFEGDPSNDLNPLDFIDQITPELKQLPLKVKIRPHPLTRGNQKQMNLIIEKINHLGFKLDNEIDFEISLKNTLFCIMYNSTSVFQSIWNGVPCWTNVNNFGYDLSIKDIVKFSEYSYPTRMPWFVKMSWCEYTREEMIYPDFWNLIVENLLDAYFNNK